MKTETKKVQLKHTTVLDNTKRNSQADFLMTELQERLSGADKYGTRQGGFITISYFENGRERGYSIERRFNVQENGEPVGIGTGSKTRWVHFAENRNSDDIVVYPFKWGDGAINDINYREKSKYFKCYDFVGASNFILEHLELTNEEVVGEAC